MGSRCALFLGLFLSIAAFPAPAAAPPDAIDAVLRVVDDETGEPLPDARVSRVLPGEGGMSYHESPLPRGTKAGEFLYRHRGEFGVVHFTVAAPGHVPMDGPTDLAVEIRPPSPFTHTIRMHRAGEVRVTLKGLLPATPLASITLNRGKTTPEIRWSGHSMRVEEGTAHMDGLPPGDYSLKIDPGERYEATPDRKFQVRAGETAEVEVLLVPRDPGTEAAAGVRGTVTFHAGWGAMSSEIRFRILGAGRTGINAKAALRGSAPGAKIPWSLGKLPPGRYRVEVDPQWYALVEVPEGGGAFDFPIPEPAVVTVRVVAEESGEPLDGMRLWWYYRAGEGGGGLPYTADNGKPGARAGEFRLVVPPGSVEIVAKGPGRVESTLKEEGSDFWGFNPTFGPGEKAERVLRLPRAGAVRLLLRCGGRLLDRSTVDVKIRTVYGTPGNGGSVTRGMEGRTGTLSCEGLPPGKHTIRILDPDGRYEPVPDREIVVRAGETLELTQELVERQ